MSHENEAMGMRACSTAECSNLMERRAARENASRWWHRDDEPSASWSNKFLDKLGLETPPVAHVTMRSTAGSPVVPGTFPFLVFTLNALAQAFEGDTKPKS